MAKIDEIEEANTISAQRQKLWDKWADYSAQLAQDLADADKDPFESEAANRIKFLCKHILGQMNREAALSLLDFIQAHGITDLKKTYKPGIKDYSMLALQVLGAMAGAAVSMVPGVANIAGPQASIYNSIGSGINSGVVGGSQTLHGIFSNMKQGDQQIEGHKLEHDKRVREDNAHKQQQEQQEAQAALKDEQEKFQRHHQVIQEINR